MRDDLDKSIKCLWINEFKITKIRISFETLALLIEDTGINRACILPKKTYQGIPVEPVKLDVPFEFIVRRE